jgi:hypothetical protein
MRGIKVYGQLFLVIGVAGGLLAGALLGAWFDLVDVGSYGEGFTIGLVGGLVSGVLISATLGTLQVLGFRDAPKGMSHSPRQSREVPVANGPDLADRIVTALRSLPAEVTAVDVPAGRYVARRRANWKSWGEDVVVRLSGDPANPMATVSSRPRVSITLMDYGRGLGNVEHVVGALSVPQGRQPSR